MYFQGLGPYNKTTLVVMFINKATLDMPYGVIYVLAISLGSYIKAIMTCMVRIDIVLCIICLYMYIHSGTCCSLHCGVWDIAVYQTMYTCVICMK